VNTVDVRIAYRALHKEFLAFKFDYPLHTVPESQGVRPLHYFLHSEDLKWEAMRMDATGIPKAWYRSTGAAYWPAYIAWYGIIALGKYLRTHQQSYLDVFMRQVDWIERNATVRRDGAACWPMHFDYKVGNTWLRAPWVSAHAQGLAISALVRAYRMTHRSSILDLLRRSAAIYSIDHRAGGIRVRFRNLSFYTEVPGGPWPGILDGFLTSLLGLYDLWDETGDPNVRERFDEGVTALETTISSWDYRGKWSWYGNRAYLCPPAYHCLNRLLLATVGRLANRTSLERIAGNWDPSHLRLADRIEIYSRFVWTKNLTRIRHRTWTERPVASSCSSGHTMKRLPGTRLVSSHHDAA